MVTFGCQIVTPTVLEGFGLTLIADAFLIAIVVK